MFKPYLPNTQRILSFAWNYGTIPQSPNIPADSVRIFFLAHQDLQLLVTACAGPSGALGRLISTLIK